jgi:hypothetical protein
MAALMMLRLHRRISGPKIALGTASSEPYALSIVGAACPRETPERVTAVHVLDAAGGGKFEEASVEWAQHPPAWMSTDAFRRAALRPETIWIDKPRLGTSVLTLTNDQPKYVREKGLW